MRLSMLPRRDSARDDELVRYLLGELPDEDAERLDEQSIADDEFAARLRLVEDELVDAYASGRLTGERRRHFESFYLASPRRREKAAFAKRLLEAVEQDVRRRQGDVAPAKRGPLAWWQLAAAAAVVLGLATTWLSLQDARLRTALNDARQQAATAERRAADLSTALLNAQHATSVAQAWLTDVRAAQPVALVLLPQTRGVGPVPIVAVTDDSPSLRIELAIEALTPVPHEAALKDPATNQIIWRSSPLSTAPAPPALVAVSVPTAILKSQHYVLDLFARRSERNRDFVGSYPFEVLRR
jgi:anti-sigma factor RsiW